MSLIQHNTTQPADETHREKKFVHCGNMNEKCTAEDFQKQRKKGFAFKMKKRSPIRFCLKSFSSQFGHQTLKSFQFLLLSVVGFVFFQEEI